jgi:hypothetical protein
LASFFIASGNRQAAVSGSAMAQPLSVRAIDSAGHGIASLAVTWRAKVGTLSATTTPTDAGGNAAVTLTAGSPGTDTVVARLSGRADSVLFIEYGTQLTPLVAQYTVPANYGIHDTFVRDGIAFACVWNTGVFVLDVGDGRAGGSPSNPIAIDTILTNTGVTGGRQAHNAWWFHNPVSMENRYLFVGQEGPGILGVSSSGDIHVVDVSNLSNGTEVAFYRMPNVNGQTTGVHNFWMDEQAQILYAAYYNGGVVAIDVSDTLVGDLAAREIARIQPGGTGNTFVWSVQLSPNGSLYAVDMLSGVWQLSRTGSTFSVAGGGNNVPERFSSDFWVYGNHIYSGTWGTRAGNPGNALKIWRLVTGGAPQLVREILTPGIGTVSDVQVSDDGKLLVFSAENGSATNGLYVYDLTDPENPVPVGRSAAFSLHTATIAEIGGRRYVFAAKNPGNPALMVFDITDLTP